MPPAHVIVIAIAVAAIAYALWERRRATYARYALSERDAMLKNNARLLIKKTSELMDENMEQQRMLQSRGDFVGIVSHQLRTPATEIAWSVDAVLSDPAGQLTEPQRMYLEKLMHSSKRMVRIIDHLLRLVNLEQGYTRIVAAPYDVDSAVEAAARSVSTQFLDRKINLVFDLTSTQAIDSMDSDSLEMAVGNLVENAYHYTPDGGTVTVRTEPHEAGGVMVTVSDTGVGIPLEKQKSVFVKFQRSDAARRMNSGGMGLGLYIVKTVIERHGGAVGFETEEGKGTTFWFTVPQRRVRLR